MLLLLLELVIHLVRGNRANQPIGRVLYSIPEVTTGKSHVIDYTSDKKSADG